MIANGDDPELVRRLKARGGTLVTFGAACDNDLKFSQLEIGHGAISFEVNGAFRFRLQGHGRFNARNALAAIAAAHYFKLDLGELAESWEAIPPVLGRFQCLDFEDANIRIIDDSYNANPYAFGEAVQSFSEEAGVRRKIVVCGDMLELGHDGPAYHEALGRVLADAGIDWVIGVGPLSRFVLNSFSKLKSPARAQHFETSQAVESYLLSLVQEGDSVLIKGSNGIGLGMLKDALARKLAVS